MQLRPTCRVICIKNVSREMFMSGLTIDESTESALREFARLEVHNSAGRLVGYLVQVAPKEDYVGVRSPHSDEELRDRAREGGGRPLADILRDFEKLQ